MNWDDYPDFSRWEFECSETGECEMNQRFMDKLQALRAAYGRIMSINSGYRSPRHSIEAAKKGGPGPHAKGVAADIEVGPGEAVHALLALAFQFGFTGVGVSQREGEPRFVHLDLDSRLAVWSY